MTRNAYTYVVLRYAHDPASGESLNIGVLIHSSDAFYVDVLFEETYSRLSAAFASFDGKAYHRVTSEFKRAVGRVRDIMSKRPLLDGAFQNAGAIAAQLWPDPGLSFKVGELLGGLTEDLPATTRALFERFVASQFIKRESKRRDEADVWEAVEYKFPSDVLTHLRPVEVRTKYFEHTFQYAFRNQHLHVVEPISFDYVEPASIIEAGTKWRGRLDVIAAASDERDGEFHFIVGQPKPQHRAVAERAMEMIRDAGIETDVVTEDAADLVVARLSRAVLEH